MKSELRQANAEEIRDMIHNLRKDHKTFHHIFSNYTNTIELPDKKIKWVKELRSDRTFVAFRMVKRDVESNPLSQWICKQEWKTENYSNADFDDDELDLPHIINIDISSCYPNFLRVERLISQQTFDLLMKLDKNERLPAIGMIAYNRIRYMYKDGYLMNIVQEKSELAPIFFYIVHKVQELFIKLREIAGQYYIFHWVDGIFLFPDVPGAIIDKIERTIRQCGFDITIESCRDFQWRRKNEVISLEFTKGGEKKTYKLRDVHWDDHYNQLVRSIHREDMIPRAFFD